LGGWLPAGVSLKSLELPNDRNRIGYSCAIGASGVARSATRGSVAANGIWGLRGRRNRRAERE